MKKNNFIEISFFCIFVILVLFLSLFHEPWFDEMQVWGISKDSIYNILFVIPHYEGHPPLWSLILKIFSSMNIHPELGIRIPNLIFIFSAVWLLIFKSPFPRVVRVILPFTYFIFYQYAVINRPYSLFCFALVLSALLYKNRNNSPFKFVFALILLSCSSAYGMLVSTGIIISWGIELLNNRKIFEFLKDFIKDKRFFAVLIFVIFNFILVCEIFPVRDTIALSKYWTTDYYIKTLYSFLVLCADSTVYNYISYYSGNIFFLDFFDFFKKYSLPLINLMIFKFWLGCAIGLVINIIFIWFFKKAGKLLLFLIPYIMFILMAEFGYISPHHIGLMFIFFVFAFWCSYDCNTNNFIQNDKKKINLINIFVFVCIFIQLYWSCCAFCNEITKNYSVSRDVVNYIKQYKLYNYKMMAYFLYTRPFCVNKKTGKLDIGEPVKNVEEAEQFNKDYTLTNKININDQSIAVVINQYFNRNLFYSFNLDYPDKLYTRLHQNSDEENERMKTRLQSFGLPEVLVGNANVNWLFNDDDIVKNNYIVFKIIPYGYVWKNKYQKTKDFIYLRKDIMDKLIKENQDSKKTNS